MAGSRSGSPTCVARGAPDVAVSFSHCHLYVDSVADIDTYKNLESQLAEFASKCICGGDEIANKSGLDIEKGRVTWNSIVSPEDSRYAGNGTSRGAAEFVPQNRDVVKQLIAGLGFRVTGKRMASDNGVESNTRTVLVTSCDPKGVQIVVTALDPGDNGVKEDKYAHFDAGKSRKLHCTRALVPFCSIVICHIQLLTANYILFRIFIR